MFLGLDLTAWTAILALATVLLAGITVWLTVSGRRQDDAKRSQDRTRDDQLRAEERERDDQLRTEARLLAESREHAERIAWEDRDARQVLVSIKEVTFERSKGGYTHEITVSTPHTYPVKQLEVQFAYNLNGNMSTWPLGHSGKPPDITEERMYYRFHAKMTRSGETPIIRWVDWRGNRYYQYLHYTERFGQNTDWLEAASKIDKWVRTGPSPD